jgi:hypothetical protein
MSNANFTAALSGFANAGPYGYRSADAADFGAVSENGSFAAFVTVIPRGSAQSSQLNAQYLWGNNDASDANRGWSISIEIVGGQLAIVGRVGYGSGVSEITLAISGTGLSAFAERMMQIGLWLSTANSPGVRLTVNGSIAAVAGVTLPDTFAPSAFPVGLGIPPVSPSTIAATEIDIVGAGYTYNVDFDNDDDVADYAGRAWNAARGACGAAVALDPDTGADWVHRYSAAQLGQGQPAAITKQPTSAQLRQDAFPNPDGYATVPAAVTLADQGNVLTPTNADTQIVAYNPVALSRLGALFTGGYVVAPFLRGRKNVDWYQGGSYLIPEA